MADDQKRPYYDRERIAQSKSAAQSVIDALRAALFGHAEIVPVDQQSQGVKNMYTQASSQHVIDQ